MSTSILQLFVNSLTKATVNDDDDDDKQKAEAEKEKRQKAEEEKRQREESIKNTKVFLMRNIEMEVLVSAVQNLFRRKDIPYEVNMIVNEDMDCLTMYYFATVPSEIKNWEYTIQTPVISLTLDSDFYSFFVGCPFEFSDNLFAMHVERESVCPTTGKKLYHSKKIRVVDDEDKGKIVDIIMLALIKQIHKEHKTPTPPPAAPEEASTTLPPPPAASTEEEEIGRASCRERVSSPV